MGAAKVGTSGAAAVALPASKPLKTNGPGAAIASGLSRHLPETRNQNEKPTGFSGGDDLPADEPPQWNWPAVDLAVAEAAQWLATGSVDRSKAVIPQLQERFALPLKDAVEACRQAALIRARAH